MLALRLAGRRTPPHRRTLSPLLLSHANFSSDKEAPPSSPIPGIAAAASVTTVSFAASSAISTALAIPISGIPVSILLGLAANNVISLPPSLSPGLKLCTTDILRAGIISVGFKLSLLDLISSGAIGIPVVLTSMAAGFIYVPLAARAAGLSPELGSLLAIGTSVCGVTAITAAAPVIRASPSDTAVAVANVVAFGTLGMLTFPYLAHATLSSSPAVGMFLGTAIHDTAQVLGSVRTRASDAKSESRDALAFPISFTPLVYTYVWLTRAPQAATYSAVYADDAVLKVAAVTKLTRNLFLAGVIPGLAYQYATPKVAAGAPAATPSAISGLATFKSYVPNFVLFFIGAAAVRSAGDATLLSSGAAFYLLDEPTWNYAIKAIGGDMSTALLGTAMAAVGLSTNRSALAGVGVKPFLVGGSGAVVVGGTAFSLIQILEASNFLN